jgi:hypothetical protein
MTVGDGDHFHLYVRNAIDNEKGKARQLRATRALRRLRPALRIPKNFPTGKFKLIHEAGCGQVASLRDTSSASAIAAG